MWTFNYGASLILTLKFSPRNGAIWRDFMRKIAIITGASSGIGGATAVALAERGVDSILTFHNHEDRVRDVVEAVL